MNFLSKFQPVFIILSALSGIALGKSKIINEQYTENGIQIFLVIMLFFVFLDIEIKKISTSFLDLRFSVSALIINFIFTPLFAFVLSKLFLYGQIDLQTGFIMLLVTPCTDWYLIFTGVANGNVPLGASILPLNLILQIVLLPVYLLVFMRTGVSFGAGAVIYSIILVLIIPMLIANAFKFILKKINRQNILAKIIKNSGDIQFIMLCLAIVSMFASKGTLLLANLILFIKLAPALLVFFVIVFCVSLFTGKILKLPFKNTIALVFTTQARNSPVALALAVVTFPSRPLISLVLVMGPLIELPVLAVNSLILKRQNRLL
ncbi:MAG: bile acid:sodium symporter [Spirochaetaceae bacterium]|jgi:ACR3 family arsenite efflux pump ArsB|nr:bile acid:sodium symporter [Spirochaetaceae bacterium]